MTTHTELAAPLPCPFCGHVGLDFKEGSTFRWIVAECSGCGASRGETRIQTLGEGTKDEWMADAKEDAIREWNTRAAALESTERLAGDGEPVAWRYRFHTDDSLSGKPNIRNWTLTETQPPTRAGDIEVQTLYTTPPPQAERVPLSDEQIWASDEIMAANGTVTQLPMNELCAVVRAVEAAHGITPKEST